MSYQLSFATTGLMIRTGDGAYDLHLASVSTFGGSTITVSGRVVEDGVTLTEVGSSVQHNFQIADCSSPVYATPQDLMDDIETAIAAMYAGGGGGGGTVDTVGWTNQYGMSANTSGTTSVLIQPVGTESVIKTIAQIGHGLTLGQPVRMNGGAYVAAQGNSAANAAYVGFVLEVVSANQFRLLTAGHSAGAPAAMFSGLTAGTAAYLSPSSAGALTNTPNAFGPVLMPTSATAGYVLSNAESAIIADLIALSGVAVNSTNLGVFNGSTIPDDSDTKEALQAIEDAFEAAVALAAAPLTRTGSAIAFDARAVYNSPDTPTSGAITVDLSGAVVNTQAVCYCNHAAEPTWPAGVTAVGVWDNSQLNVVTFTYTADGISAEIVSDAQGSYTNPTVPYVLTSGNIVNTTTTPSVVTGISFNVLAGETYHIQGKVRCSGTAAGGVHFGFQGAGISSMEVNMFGTTTGATAFGTERVSSSGGMGTTDFAKYASTTNPWVQFDGFFVGGASDQVVDLIVASDLAAENATVYASNSILYVTLLT